MEMRAAFTCEPADSAVGLFRNALRQEMGLQLSRVILQEREGVFTYVGRAPHSHVSKEWMDDFTKTFMEVFYNDVAKTDAHVLRTSVCGLPILMLSTYSTDEHHVVLIHGQHDEVPKDWLWELYKNYKK
jgi:hypothetical protein